MKSKKKIMVIYIFRVIELKGTLRLEKENNDENLYEKMRKSASHKEGSSRSKERTKSKSSK